jgi:Protein of unknown function (DUF1360)
VIPGRMTSLRSLTSGYDPHGEVDVRGYAGSLTAYAGALAVAVALGRVSGATLPDRYAPLDLAIGGLATHKASRLLSKASVTSPIRAPFTEFAAPTGSGEHREAARGEHGLRHTIGELVSCPFCLGVWIGSAYVAGLVLAPRPTRAVAAMLTVVAGSDMLQHVYARLRGD